MTPDTPFRRLAAATECRGRIEITVDPEGGLALKTLGFTGSDCRTASRFLEEALGSVTTEKLLPAYYAADQRADQQQGQSALSAADSRGHSR